MATSFYKTLLTNTLTDVETAIEDYVKQYSTIVPHKISLSSGFAGVAVLYGYLAKYYKDDRYYNQCQQVLEFCIDHINSTHEPSLYGGHAGVAWTIRHLVNLGAFHKNSLEILYEIDPIIEKSSEIFIKNKFYSLMYGLIGHGIYYLEMIDNADLTNEVVDPFENLRKIVIALDNFSIPESNTITWIDYVSTAYKNSLKPTYNLGLPHGVTGVLCFLSKMYAMGIEKERSLNLLKYGVEWLLKQKNNFYDISYYPSLVSEDYSPHLTRLGWSYGDLCSALALLYASRVLDDISLEKEALNTALISTKRDLKTAIVYTKIRDNFKYLDVGLCKGTLGIIMLYNRLYEHFQDDTLKKAQEFWMDLTFRYKNAAGGIGGYQSYISNDREEGRWTEDVSFLDGMSGTGLSFISLLNPQLNKWQRLLLL